MPDWIVRIKNYFIFSRKESRGMFILALLLLLIMVAGELLPFFFSAQNPDFTGFERQIAELKQQEQVYSDHPGFKSQSIPSDGSNPSLKINPFPFNPNGLPEETWKKLGMSERQIRAIINYEAKGGSFREKEDLAKIYVISPEEYQVLEPFITIPLQTVKSRTESTSELKPFHFDPNTLEKEKWMEMGLDEKVVNAVMNYRAKGGHFYTAGDLKKIYSLREEEYAALEPFIEIKKDEPVKAESKEIQIIDLNKADTLDLQILPGIGSSFARRIVKYRDLLGGFYTKEQLLEVYGMDSARYTAIRDFVYADIGAVKKMNINTITIKEMTKHPYFEFYLAKSILNYRKEIGNYTAVEQILQAKLVYDQLFNKIEPYLTTK